jgi:hypothetical protein
MVLVEYKNKFRLNYHASKYKIEEELGRLNMKGSGLANLITAQEDFVFDFITYHSEYMEDLEIEFKKMENKLGNVNKILQDTGKSLHTPT